MTGISEEEEQQNDKGKGLMNADNAWCWREGCEGKHAKFVRGLVWG